ncbi:hypothetical protein HQ520_07880, partial [bacterium]|nr:hypothetical protein [bacterium]
PIEQVPFQEELAPYEELDQNDPPPKKGILFIGSSTIREWQDLKEHMAPLPVFNRAFGGSKTWEVLHFMDRLVLPYRPKGIVYYAGDNDLATPADSPERAFEGFRLFAQRAHRELPQAHVFYVSIKPSPARWPVWDKVRQANAMARQYCEQDSRCEFIDITDILLGEDGRPRPDLYREDLLHIQPEVYKAWADRIRPYLVDL